MGDMWETAEAMGWENQVMEWRKWALKQLGKPIKEYQQEDDSKLREELEEMMGGTE